jgi:hypothetical protein
VGGPEVNITSPCRIQLKRRRKKIEEDDFPMDFWPFGGSQSESEAVKRGCKGQNNRVSLKVLICSNYGYGSLGAL